MSYDTWLLPKESDGMFRATCLGIIWHCGCGSKADDIIEVEEGLKCSKCGARASWEQRHERTFRSSYDNARIHTYEICGDFTRDACDETWESAGHANEAYGVELTKQDNCPCCGSEEYEVEPV